MASERSSAGDPARTLALLWRDSTALPSRGPRRSIDLDTVVSAAVAVADTDGAVGLTMRAVAQHLGVPTMSLYTHVPGKAELIDLMLDAVYAGIEWPDDDGAPWRDRVRAVADANRSLFRAHPWAAEVSTLRPPLGPGQLGKYERELAAFDGCGMTDVEVDGCHSHLLTFVRANARDAADARTARGASAMDDEQWWAAAGPLLARLVDPSAYPRATRIGTAAGEAHGSALDPDHAYRFGLQRVLDGLAPLVERTATS